MPRYIRDVLLLSTGGWSTAHSAWFRGCNSFCLYITGVQYCCYGDGLKWAGNFILIKFYSWAEEEGSIFSITYGIFWLGHMFCKQQQTWKASCIFPPDASTWKYPLGAGGAGGRNIPARRAPAQGQSPHRPRPHPPRGPMAKTSGARVSRKVGNGSWNGSLILTEIKILIFVKQRNQTF